MAHPGVLHDSDEGLAPILLPDSPGHEDVVGLRICAALVDLALLAGVFVIIACAVGQVGEGRAAPRGNCGGLPLAPAPRVT